MAKIFLWFIFVFIVSHFKLVDFYVGEFFYGGKVFAQHGTPTDPGGTGGINESGGDGGSGQGGVDSANGESDPAPEGPSIDDDYNGTSSVTGPIRCTSCSSGPNPPPSSIPGSTPAPFVPPPATPNLRIDGSGCGISNPNRPEVAMSWMPNPEPYASRYEIWRSRPDQPLTTGNGLETKISDNKTFNSPTFLSQVYNWINVDWGSGSPDSAIGSNTFSVIWSSRIKAPVTGDYYFQTEVDDGVKVVVDNITVIDDFVDGNRTVNSFRSIFLEEGKYYRIDYYFFEESGGAKARLRWRYPGQASYITIPTSAYYLTNIFTEKIASSVTGYNYTDTTALPNTNYTYRVVALGAGGFKSSKDTPTITTEICPRPTITGIASACISGQPTINVSFTPVSGMIGYRARRSQSTTNKVFTPDTGNSLQSTIVSYWKGGQIGPTGAILDALNINPAEVYGIEIKPGKINNAPYFPGFAGAYNTPSDSTLNLSVKKTPYITGVAKIGYAGSFDGYDDSLMLQPKPSAISPTNALTVSAWAFPKLDDQPNYVGIVTNRISNSNDPWNSYQLGITSGGSRYQFCLSNGTSSGSQTCIATPSSMSIGLEVWSHVVGTYDGSRMRLYINGVNVAETSKSGLIGYTGNDFRVGCALPEAQCFRGNIDEVRIYNRALSGSEVTTLYNFNGTNTDVTAGRTAYWKMDEPTWYRALQIENNPSINLPNNYSLSMWIYPERVSGIQGLYTKFLTTGTTINHQYGLSLENNQLRFDSEGTTIRGGNVPANTWSFVVVTVNSSGYVRLFLNNVQVAEGNGPSNADELITPILVGLWNNVDTPNRYQGLIDEIGYWNDDLSTQEMTELYNNGDGNPYILLGTNPKIVANNIPGNSLADSSVTGGMFYGYQVAGNSSSTGKIGNSGEFDGYDDIVRVPQDTTLQPADKLTISAWVKPAVTSQPNIGILSKRYNDTASPWNSYMLGVDGNKYIFCLSTGAQYCVRSTVNVTTDWHHLVGTYDSATSTMELYVDTNIPQASATVTGNILYSSLNLRIGCSQASTNECFNGLIDEVRLYNRYLAPVERLTLLNYDGTNTQPTTAGLRGYWKFDEASWAGTPGEVIDSSNTDNHGQSLNGAAITYSGTSYSKWSLPIWFQAPYCDSTPPTGYYNSTLEACYSNATWPYENLTFKVYATDPTPPQNPAGVAAVTLRITNTSTGANTDYAMVQGTNNWEITIPASAFTSDGQYRMTYKLDDRNFPTPNTTGFIDPKLFTFQAQCTAPFISTSGGSVHTNADIKVVNENQTNPLYFVSSPVRISRTSSSGTFEMTTNIQPSEIQIQYGTSANSLTSIQTPTPSYSLVNGNTKATVTLSGLSGNTTYYYKIIVKNGSNYKVESAVNSFTTN